MVVVVVVVGEPGEVWFCLVSSLTKQPGKEIEMSRRTLNSAKLSLKHKQQQQYEGVASAFCTSVHQPPMSVDEKTHLSFGWAPPMSSHAPLTLSLGFQRTATSGTTGRTAGGAAAVPRRGPATRRPGCARCSSPAVRRATPGPAATLVRASSGEGRSS